MNKKNYIEYKLELYHEIKKYFNSEYNTDTNSYFYFINQENFNILNKEFNFLSSNDKQFLYVYFMDDIAIDKKLELLNFKSKNEYYNTYRKIVTTIIKKG